MQEIQTRAQNQAPIDPDAFKYIAAGIADQHRDDIILGAASPNGIERRLAATLLGMASPSGRGATALVALASDEVPDVRYAALLAISAATDGTNRFTNDAVLNALKESGNPSLTRDAAFAASSLKLPDALPVFEQLLRTDDALNKRYAADAAMRYGAMAIALLPELRRQIAQVSDPDLKADLQRAEASIARPAVFTPEPPVARLSSGQQGANVTLTPPASKPTQTAPEVRSAQPKKQNPPWLFATMVIVFGTLCIASFLKLRRRNSSLK